MKRDDIVFNGIKFRRYPTSKNWAHKAYYSPSGGYLKKGVGHLHREIWKFYRGPIPKGYVVHHKDGDFLNNTIENLECLSEKEHNKHHQRLKKGICTQQHLDSLPAAREAAKVWHGSAQGLQWHREHVRDSLWKKNKKRFTKTCKQCGKLYKCWFDRGIFCGYVCRNRYYAFLRKSVGCSSCVPQRVWRAKLVAMGASPI